MAPYCDQKDCNEKRLGYFVTVVLSMVSAGAVIVLVALEANTKNELSPESWVALSAAYVVTVLAVTIGKATNAIAAVILSIGFSGFFVVVAAEATSRILLKVIAIP